MSRFLSVLILTLLIVLPVIAEDNADLPAQQDVTPDLLYNEALGFFAGEMGGTGLSYHRTSGTRGWQAVFGALYTPEGASNLLFYNLGFSHLWKVFANQWENILAGNLYIFASLMHDGSIPNNHDWESGTSSPGAYSPRITAGFGIGIELIAFEHFSLPVEVGYGFSWLPLESPLSDQFLIDLYPQAGFRYRY